MSKKVEKSAEVKKFEADYADIKAKIKLINRRIRELHEEVKSISDASYTLIKRMFNAYQPCKSRKPRNIKKSSAN